MIPAFSAYGTTMDGHAKPDLVAPGKDIVMHLPNNNKLVMGKEYPSNQIDSNYFRMSGTSMAAPIVAGAVALLLQAEPTLTPDQVNYRLMATARKDWAGYDPVRAGAGYLDVYAALKGTTTASANTGLTSSKLLWTGSDPITWNSVSWNSVSWNSDYWNDDVVAANVIIEEESNQDQGMNGHVAQPAADVSTQSNVVFLPVVTR